jgi:selenocysteine lyase/cysteine desulfurase
MNPSTDAEADALVRALKEQKIVTVKHWDRQNNPYIRASLHCYNDQTDIDRLISALEESNRK